MESTSVYWIPIFELLDARGFAVFVVNARDAKHVPGRKTDVSDAQWLQRLHSYGLLRASFRPKGQIAELRAYVRQRERLLEYAASHIQHMQKALTEMNLQLHHVVADITGATGQLSDLRMKRLHVDRRQRRLAAAAGPEYIGSTFLKQGLPRRNLVRVDVKMLRKLGQSHLALDGGKRHLGLERRCVVPSGSSGHRLS